MINKISHNWHFLSGDYITAYDIFDPAHQQGFIELFVANGVSRKLSITGDYALAITKVIEQEFRLDLVCSTNTTTCLGFAVTRSTCAAEGALLALESLFIIPEAHNYGYDLQLIYNNLIDAFEAGLVGYAWETNRLNTPAKKLYTKIDPLFDPEKLHNVWRISERQTRAIALAPASLAQLAVTDDLNNISKTLERQPDRDLGHISRLLQRQEHNGLSAPSFAVASDAGAFALASQGYSTFEGCRKSDVRVYLPAELSEPDITDLFKAVSREMERRNWRGSQHIEFANSVVGIDEDRLAAERKRVAFAENILVGLGGERLVHNDDPMVAYSLSGKRFISAVINAVNITRRPLQPEMASKLSKKASQYGLAFGQAA